MRSSALQRFQSLAVDVDDIDPAGATVELPAVPADRDPGTFQGFPVAALRAEPSRSESPGMLGVYWVKDGKNVLVATADSVAIAERRGQAKVAREGVDPTQERIWTSLTQEACQSLLAIMDDPAHPKSSAARVLWETGGLDEQASFLRRLADQAPIARAASS